MAGRGNPSFLKNQKAKKRQERANEKRAARQARNAEKRAAREAETDAPQGPPVESLETPSEDQS
jgi:hypothetical protein